MQQATDEEKNIIADINSKAQAELAEIRKKIVSKADVARASLQKEVDDFANQICQKILGRAV
jgi:F-type H+-transporting ATPase subunit b